MKDLRNIVLTLSLGVFSSCDSTQKPESKSIQYEIKPGKYLIRVPNIKEKIKLDRFFDEENIQNNDLVFSRPYYNNAILEIEEDGSVYVYPIGYSEDKSKTKN